MTKKILRFFGAAFFWLLLWEGLSLLVGKSILLPSPIEVGKRLFELAKTADFWLAAGNSLLRIALGFLLGTALGILIAAMTVRFPFLRSLLSPALSVIKATPVASFIILAFICMSTGSIPVLTAVLIVLPGVWANMETGIKEIDPKLLEMGKAFRLSLSRRITKIILPSLKPYFLAAVHSAMGMAWKAGIAAEVICPYGISLGHNLHDAKVYMETADVFAWTAVVIIMSVLLEKLLLFLLRGKEKSHAAI